MIKRPQTAVVGLKVRMREPLRKKLEVAAKQKGVSLNSELISRLESSFSSEAVEQVIGAKVEQALIANTEKWDKLAEKWDKIFGMSPHNLVTRKGLEMIETELARLHREHAAAQDADDKPKLAKINRDLRYWTSRRATAQVVEPPRDRSEVRFGSTVTIEREDGRRQTYRIVGEDEADPSVGTLSYASPVAQALMGKQVGDTVQAGTAAAEIVEIS